MFWTQNSHTRGDSVAHALFELYFPNGNKCRPRAERKKNLLILFAGTRHHVPFLNITLFVCIGIRHFVMCRIYACIRAPTSHSHCELLPSAVKALCVFSFASSPRLLFVWCLTGKSKCTNTINGWIGKMALCRVLSFRCFFMRPNDKKKKKVGEETLETFLKCAGCRVQLFWPLFSRSFVSSNPTFSFIFFLKFHSSSVPFVRQHHSHFALALSAFRLFPLSRSCPTCFH